MSKLVAEQVYASCCSYSSVQFIVLACSVEYCMYCDCVLYRVKRFLAVSHHLSVGVAGGWV